MTGAAEAAEAGVTRLTPATVAAKRRAAPPTARGDASGLGGVDGDETHAGERRRPAPGARRRGDLHEAGGAGPDGVGEGSGRRAVAAELERRLQPGPPGGAVEAGAQAQR